MKDYQAVIMAFTVLCVCIFGAWVLYDAQYTDQYSPADCTPGPTYATIKPWDLNTIADMYHIYNITNVSSIEAFVLVHFEQTCDENK